MESKGNVETRLRVLSRSPVTTELAMKYLCLAYGAEEDWNALSKREQEELLSHDAALREQGAEMSAVRPAVTTVRAWDGEPVVTDGPYSALRIPLAGFSIIEARDMDEVIRLVKDTPCARAKGAIEIRPLWPTGG